MPPASSRFSLHRSLFPRSQHHPPDSLNQDQDSWTTSSPSSRSPKRHRIPFYQRKTKSPSLDSSPSKPSFFSRVVNKVVPCVTPPPDSSPLDQPKDTHSPDSHVAEIKLADLLTSSTADPPIAPHPQSPAPVLLHVPITPASPLLPPNHTDAPPVSTAIQSPGSVDCNNSYTSPDVIPHGQAAVLDEPKQEQRLICSRGNGIPMGPDGLPKPLLPPVAPEHAGRKCLILDLDETLVHSSFKPVPHADFIVPVELEYNWHHFHVLKRPGVDEFLRKMGELYEVVVFTASLRKYADPVLDQLDTHQVVAHRLFRESCFSHKGNYVKDLSQLGRPISDTIILDNSTASYLFHPHNAVPVSSWFNDPHDVELTDLIPFLADLTSVPDVRGILHGV